jgi:hypothetical protein
VIARVLTPDPNARFSDVRAPARALLPRASPAVSARWRRDFEVPVGETDTTRPIDDNDLPVGHETHVSTPSVGEASTAALDASSPVPHTGKITPTARERQLPPAPRVTSPHLVGGVRAVSAITLLGVLAIGAVWFTSRSIHASTAPIADTHVVVTHSVYQVRAWGVPPRGTLTLDEGVTCVGAIEMKLPRNGRRHTPVTSAPGHCAMRFAFGNHFHCPRSFSRAKNRCPKS